MKRLLIVVDYQNDHVDGALGFPEAKLLADRIAERIKAYQGRGDKIAYILDCHHADYLQTQEGRNLPVIHCLPGTDGYRLEEHIEPLYRESIDKIFVKSTFGTGDMFDWLRGLNEVAADMDTIPFESIELVGVPSDCCLLSEAVLAKTACPEVPIIIDAQCTAASDPAKHEAALGIFESLQIRIINRR